MDIDILIYIIGSALMGCMSVGFLFWGIKTGQFKENENLKRKPLEDDEEYDS